MCLVWLCGGSGFSKTTAWNLGHRIVSFGHYAKLILTGVIKNGFIFLSYMLENLSLFVEFCITRTDS